MNSAGFAPALAVERRRLPPGACQRAGRIRPASVVRWRALGEERRPQATLVLMNLSSSSRTLDLSGASGHKQAYLEVREGVATLAHAALFTFMK